MKSFPQFKEKDRVFWANIKFLSSKIGYSGRRGKGKESKIKRFSSEEIVKCYSDNKLDIKTIYDNEKFSPSEYCLELMEYVNQRADAIESVVYPNLMNKLEAKKEFEIIKKRVNPKCKLPMNKQKGEKRHHSYLSCIVNMLTEEELGSIDFDFDPKTLVHILKENKLIRTFTRYYDGAYPSTRNPKATWEIKEYYDTTTFGSRVADGIYEVMLDGEEVNELRKNEKIDFKNYLLLDDRNTWWGMGKSYLCRLIDIVNMGYVTEVLFGREIINNWGNIVRSWK